MVMPGIMGMGFRATMDEIRKKIEPTGELHEKYRRGEFFEETDSPITRLKMDNIDQKQLNMYIDTQPLHNLLEGLEDTGAAGRIGESEFSFMLIESAERGFVFQFSYDEQLRVLKPYQGAEEKKIARILSDDGIGPKVFGLGRRWLAEEYLTGPVLTEVYEKLGAEETGRIIGHIYERLHKNKVIYAYGYKGESCPIIIEEGLRHVIITKKSPKIFDFGIAKLVEKPECFSRDIDSIGQYLKLIFRDKELETAGKCFKEAYERFK